MFDGLKAVFIGIYGTPEANPLTVIDGVRAVIPTCRANCRSASRRRSPTIRPSSSAHRSHEVVKTLIEAAGIVIVVIFLFLGNLRSTIIPIVTIPLSLVGVMIALLALGYSINLLTLLALVLGIGLVVDDAIVVVENITAISRRDDAVRRRDTGAHEIALPVIAMTITLAAVYAPIGFVSGVTGALVPRIRVHPRGRGHRFGFHRADAVADDVLEAAAARHGGELVRRGCVDRTFERLRNAYHRRLQSTLNFRALTMLILIGVLALSGVMYASTPSELAPEEDQGILLSLVKTPQIGQSRLYSNRRRKTLFEDVQSVPEIAHAFVINGYPSVRGGFAGLLLSPGTSAPETRSRCWPRWGRNFWRVPTAQVQAFSPPALAGFDRRAADAIRHPHHRRFRRRSPMSRSKMQQAARRERAVPVHRHRSEIRYAAICSPRSTPTRPTASASTCADIGTALSTMLGGNYVNLFSLYGRSYEVIPQAPREFRLTPDWLTRYQVRAGNGELVPLSAVASISSQVQPNALTSFQQLNSATLSGVPFPGRTLGEALDFLKAKSAGVFPEGYSYDFQGDSRQYEQEGNALVFVFVFALIVIYLVLAAQYREFPRSLHHPDRLADGVVRGVASAQHRRVPRRCEHQHLFADRAGDVDRPHLQTRHPHGRFCQPVAGDRRLFPARGDRGGGGGAPSTDPDDDGGHGRGHGSADRSLRRRRALALRHRPDHILRNGDRYGLHPVRDAYGLYVPRAGPCRSQGARA